MSRVTKEPPVALDVEGHSIKLDKADKILFPDDGITKKDLAEYYERIAKYMLSYTKDRPLTMHRFPDGIRGEGFYQKEIGEYFPDWIEQAKMKKVGGETTYLLANNAATLVYIASQAVIVSHVWLSRVDMPENPDLLIFDLDPSGSDFEPVRETALTFREIFQRLDAQAFVKTTGSKGVHVTVPLDRSAPFDEVRTFAGEIAKICSGEDPAHLTIERLKVKRAGRIFIDIARNSYAQTAVAPYSARALPGAPVATPIEWEELEDKKLNPRSFNIKNIFERLDKKGDPWRSLWKKNYNLGKMREKLEKVKGACAR